jgi:sarcosine oxidase, subunit delta
MGGPFPLPHRKMGERKGALPFNFPTIHRLPMLLIHCPYCEEDRPELEFRNMGEAHLVRAADLANQSDADFEAFLYVRQNPKGMIYERWRHIHGCARFFNAVRNTVSDKFVMVYKAGEKRPVLDGDMKKKGRG